jgi:hypothetical protein
MTSREIDYQLMHSGTDSGVMRIFWRGKMEIKGQRGSWTALVLANKDLPVVHDTFINWQTRSYREEITNPRWIKRAPEHAASIAETGMVLVGRDKHADDQSRDGYLAILFVRNVKFENNVLSFDFVK